MAERKHQAGTSKGNGNKQEGSHRGALATQGPRGMSPSFFSSSYFNPLGRLRSEFDRMFDDFFQGWPSVGAGQRDSGWRVDIQDRDDAVVVRADAPGFEPGDFDVEIRGDNLMLCACQSEEESKEDEGYRWEKREFYRSIPLPAAIDEDKIDAQYHNGVLTLTLPKREEAKRRKIEIKS